MPGRGRRLLIVEDEPLMSSLLAEALSQHGFEVRVAPDVLAARSAVREFDPDAALLILTKHADARAAGLSSTDLPPNCGFLRKDKVRDTTYLLENLEAVFAERADMARDDKDSANPLVALSVKQLDVLRLMSMGYTNEFIAQHKEASLSSVERWIIQIFRALEIDTRGPINPRVEAVRIFVSASSLPERV